MSIAPANSIILLDPDYLRQGFDQEITGGNLLLPYDDRHKLWWHLTASLTAVSAGIFAGQLVLPGVSENGEPRVAARMEEAAQLAAVVRPGVPLIIRSVENVGKTTLAKLVQIMAGDAHSLRNNFTIVADDPYTFQDNLRAQIYQLTRGQIEQSDLKAFDDWLGLHGRTAVLVFKVRSSIQLLLPDVEGLKHTIVIIEEHYIADKEGEFAQAVGRSRSVTHFIAPLTLSQTMRYVADFQAANSGRLHSVDVDVVRYMHQVTGGYIEAINEMLLYAVRKRKAVTRELVDSFPFMDNVYNDIAHSVWSMLSQPQRDLLRRILIGGEVASVREFQSSVVAPLIRTGYLRVDSNGYLMAPAEVIKRGLTRGLTRPEFLQETDESRIRTAGFQRRLQEFLGSGVVEDELERLNVQRLLRGEEAEVKPPPGVGRTIVKGGSFVATNGIGYFAGVYGGQAIAAALKGDWSWFKGASALDVMRDFAGMTAGAGIGKASVAVAFDNISFLTSRTALRGAGNRGVPLFFGLVLMQALRGEQISFFGLAGGLVNVGIAAGVVEFLAGMRIVSSIAQGLKAFRGGGLMGLAVSVLSQVLIVEGLAALEVYLLKDEPIERTRKELAGLIMKNNRMLAKMQRGEFVDAAEFGPVQMMLAAYLGAIKRAAGDDSIRKVDVAFAAIPLPKNGVEPFSNLPQEIKPDCFHILLMDTGCSELLTRYPREEGMTLALANNFAKIAQQLEGYIAAQDEKLKVLVANY